MSHSWLWWWTYFTTLLDLLWWAFAVPLQFRPEGLSEPIHP